MKSFFEIQKIKNVFRINIPVVESGGVKSPLRVWGLVGGRGGGESLCLCNL